MDIKNAANAKRFYGLHMVEGLAEYREEGKEPFRVYCPEQTIKNADKTFDGCPVFVGHRDRDEAEADGYVVRSFYNRADGKHWAEFMITTARGEEAISKGWVLSNAYKIRQMGNPGTWHGMDYDHEVMDCYYDHLAIVPDPRYQESIVLTPEDFKTYNERKETELLRLANCLSSKKGARSMGLNFWNRQPVENSADMSKISVTLPRSGRELTIDQLVNSMDAAEMDKKNSDPNAPVMANGDHQVDLDGKKMTVNELLAAHSELLKKNSTPPAQQQPQNSDAADASAKKDEERQHMNSLRNAESEGQTTFESQHNYTIPFDTLATGKSRYGSGN